MTVRIGGLRSTGTALGGGGLAAGGAAAAPDIVGMVSVKGYGAKGNANPATFLGTDDSDAIQRTIDAAVPGQTILFPPGQYLVTKTLHVRKKGITFQGNSNDQSGILFVGAGACIELGDDDGLAWDAPNYNGTGSGFGFLGMQLKAKGDTNLLNGSGQYRAGTYGIRDWRGGSLQIDRASFTGWEYAVWGVQSDLSYFENVVLGKNHNAIYLGPRADQATFHQIWTANNDIVFNFEGCRSHHVAHWTTDTDGSATTCPVRIRNFNGTRQATGMVFDTPWLESLGAGALVVEAFFDIGSADPLNNGVLTIREPLVFVNLYTAGGTNRVLYLVRADNAQAVVVSSIQGVPGSIPWNNLRAVFKVINDGASVAVPGIWWSERESVGCRLIENYSATNVDVKIDTAVATAAYTINTVGGAGPVRLGQLALQRRFGHNNAAPGAGTWQGGDMTLNRVWAPGGAWAWLARGGTPGTHDPIIFPSLGADRGDASVNLAVGTDDVEQRWATPLTVARDANCKKLGATKHTSFAITREATATGAAVLNVKNDAGVVLKALAVGQWAEVMYSENVGDFVLRRFGSL